MKTYSLSHLSDETLLRGLIALVAQDRSTTAEMLAHIAEVVERKLYLPAGYSSMHAYCVGALHQAEDAACRRIAAARPARAFPAIFRAIAAGRLHLSAVVALGPYLTEGNAEVLLAASEHKSRKDVERFLAGRFPKSDMLEWVEPIPVPPTTSTDLSAPARIKPETPATLVTTKSTVRPLSSQSFGVQFTMSESGHEHLQYVRALLGHVAASRDIGQIVERALAVYADHLEKRKFGATSRSRHSNGLPSANSRHIPARVRHAVWERDGGQCTFVSESGHRCEARIPLEFDHVLEVARGGEATVDGIRLRCRAHNQYTAERTFGAEFMRRKRVHASEFRAAATRARAKTTARKLAEVDEKDVAAP